MSETVIVRCYCGTSPEKLVKEVTVEKFVADRMAARPMAHGDGMAAEWTGPNQMRLDDTLNPEDIEQFTVPHAAIVFIDGPEQHHVNEYMTGGRFQQERDLWREMWGRLGVEYRHAKHVRIEYRYYGVPELTVDGTRQRVRILAELFASNA